MERYSVAPSLFRFPTENVTSGLLAFAGGTMVCISLDELLPAAHKEGESRLAIVGIGFGILVMTVSLVWLG